MIFELNEKNKKIYLILAILLVLPFLYAVRYAVPSADDFTSAVRMRNGKEELGSYLMAGWRVLKQHWELQGGRWLDHIIIAFVFSFGVNNHLIHIMLFFLIIFFLVSNYIFLREFTAYYLKVDFSELLLFLIFLIGLNISSPGEVFYWFSGAVGYMLSPALNLFAFAAYIRYMRCEKKKYMIQSAILSFLSCGSVQCSIAFMYALFACFLGSYVYRNRLRNKKKLGGLLIPVAVGTIGACINLLAPGTWVRHNVYSPTGLHIFTCLKNTFKVTIERLFEIELNSYFLFSLVVVLSVILFNRKLVKKIELKIHPVFIFLAGIICSCGWFFPYITGYYTDGANGIAKRVLYIGDWILAGSLVISCIYLCIWLLRIGAASENFCKEVYYLNSVVGCIAAFLVCTSSIGIRNVNEVVLFKDLYKGICKEMYTQEMDLLNGVKTSNDNHVFVKPVKIKSDMLFELALGEWDSWPNMAIAEWYGKWAVILKE